METEFLGSSAVARLCMVHVATVIRWAKTGVLPPDARDTSGKRLYTRATIERFIRQRLACEDREMALINRALPDEL